jgi:hypothetical protein
MEPDAVAGGALAARGAVAPVYPLAPVRITRAPLRLLKASEDNLDDLLRELKMADIAAFRSAGASGRPAPGSDDGAQGTLASLVQLADVVRARLADLRLQVRQAIGEATRRGDGAVDLDLRLDPGTPAVFEVLEDFLAAAAAAAQRGYLLTEPPGREVAEFRLWALEEIGDQIAGEPESSCPFPVAFDEPSHEK